METVPPRRADDVVGEPISTAGDHIDTVLSGLFDGVPLEQAAAAGHEADSGVGGDVDPVVQEAESARILNGVPAPWMVFPSMTPVVMNPAIGSIWIPEPLEELIKLRLISTLIGPSK